MGSRLETVHEIEGRLVETGQNVPGGHCFLMLRLLSSHQPWPIQLSAPHLFLQISGETFTDRTK